MPENCCGKNLVKGAIGLVRAEFGLGTTKPEIVAERRRVCESCEEWDHGRCRSCGCYTWSKTRLAAEKCPLGKWEQA